jgi:hypothetical protein
VPWHTGHTHGCTATERKLRMASTNSTLDFPVSGYQYAFFPGQIPATLGALLLAAALGFNAYLTVKRVDTGPVAHLQFCACLASAVSAIGKIINMYGFYSVYEEGMLCRIEAVTFCFGELALLLWQFCTAVTLLLMIVNPVGALATNNAQRDRMFLVFHAFVWSAAIITTAVPWALDALGMSWYPQNPEETYWCYMRIGQRSWEVGQYYIPQLVSCSFSLLVFCVIMVYLLRNEASRAGSKVPPFGVSPLILAPPSDSQPIAIHHSFSPTPKQNANRVEYLQTCLSVFQRDS